MRAKIANLLLLIGTVLGAIGAANSAKASRWLALADDAYAGEFVARDVLSEAGAAGEDVATPVLVPGGAELTAEVVATLRGAGHAGVAVKDPPIDHEILPTADRAALEGRILATAIKLGEEDSEIPAGRRVTGVLLGRCAAAGVARIDVTIDGEGESLPTAAETVPEDLEAQEAAERRKAFDEAFAAVVKRAEESARVAETFTLREDVVVKQGSFLDAEAVDKILAADLAEADVRIVKRFKLGGWEQRYLYLAAIAAMVIGVVLKRATPVDDEDGGAAGTLGAGEVRRRIGALADKLADLAGSVGTMDAAAIHAALDPLLTEDVYEIVENRFAVATKLGPGGFVAVFGPFASAERQLNRAWSAAVDGYAEEARLALQRGADGMVETVQAYPRA